MTVSARPPMALDAGTRMSRRIVLILGSYAVLAGLLTLGGWVAGLPRLTDWLGTGIAMFVNTAVAATCAGAALILASGDGRWARRLSLGLGLVVLFIGGASLLEHVTGTAFGIDELLLKHPWGIKAAAAPGRMGPPAASCFSALGLALLLIRARLQVRRAIPIAGLLISTISLLSLIGYSFGAQPLFSLAAWTGIAFQTASILLALGIALMWSVPDLEPTRTLSQDSAAGVLARRILPAIAALCVALGLLTVRIQSGGLVDTATGTAVLVLAEIIFIGVLLWWTVGAVATRERQQRIAEEALRDSEARLSGLISSAMDAVIAVDSDQRIVLFNPAAEEMFKCASSEVLGQSLNRFIPRPVQQTHRQHIEDFARTGVTTRRMGALGALKGVRANGIEFPIEASISHLQSKGQQLFTVILRDITERKQAEADRERQLKTEHELRAEAEESNRLKDEFLAIVSHELRNPLNVMVGYSEILLQSDEVTQSTPLLRAADAIRRSARTQAQLVRDLMDLSRLRSGRIDVTTKTIPLFMTIENAVEMVRDAATEKGITLEVVRPDEAIVVEGDRVRLEQVVSNLLDNSVKFTPAGGRITVRVAKRGDEAEITVEDTGQGIEPLFLPHVFEPFRQGDTSINRTHGGLGIGLAVVRQLVEGHKGKVWAESAGAGAGATFHLSLPLSAKSLADSGAVSSMNSAAVVGDVAVLVVDDSPDTADMLSALLGMSGATVRAATSGEDGLRILADTRIDVVITDISMPGMDGFAFLRKLRDLPQGSDIPVLALTGLGRPEDIERAAAAGFHAHITKPVQIDALVQVLVKALKGRASRAAV